jgi:hypothetical protein
MIVIPEHRIRPPHIHSQLRNLARDPAIRRPNVLVDIACPGGLRGTVFVLIGWKAIDVEDRDVLVPLPAEVQGRGGADGSCSADYQDPGSTVSAEIHPKRQSGRALTWIRG